MWSAELQPILKGPSLTCWVVFFTVNSRLLPSSWSNQLTVQITDFSKWKRGEFSSLAFIPRVCFYKQGWALPSLSVTFNPIFISEYSTIQSDEYFLAHFAVFCRSIIYKRRTVVSWSLDRPLRTAGPTVHPPPILPTNLCLIFVLQAH